MAKIQKTSPEVKSAIQRKSAYSLPNNPTESGYKANDIRNAFYKPIIDAANSALTEIDRLVDELNGVMEYSSNDVDSISTVSGVYYHGSDGLIYTFANNEFTVSGYEGTKAKNISIPSSVFFQDEYYPVVAIGDEAFKDSVITGVEIPSSVASIGDRGFAGCSGLHKVKLLGDTEIGSLVFIAGSIDFSVPKEYLSEYQTSLASYKRSLVGFDTIIHNANDIVVLYNDKLNKVVSTDSNQRVYGIGTTGAQITKKLVLTPTEGEIPIYLTGGRIKVGNPTEGTDSTNRNYVEGRLNSMGSYIDFTIDPTTYVMTLRLKNESGTVLSSGQVDLPLESMILGATYADGILTLSIKPTQGHEPTTISVNISDLISGLVSDETFNSEIDRLDDRIDNSDYEITVLRNEVDQKEIYGSAAYHAEEAETASNYSAGGKIDKKFRSIDREVGSRLSISMDSEYKLTVALLNKKGGVISSGMIDLPIESLIARASYANGILTLTFQNGQTTNIDITSLISGLVADTRKINGKRLNADITLTASDVNAYSKSETYSKSEVSNLIQAIQVQIDNLSVDVAGYSVISEEAEKARGYIKGGQIDKQFKKLTERVKNLENQ